VRFWTRDLAVSRGFTTEQNRAAEMVFKQLDFFCSKMVATLLILLFFCLVLLHQFMRVVNYQQPWCELNVLSTHSRSFPPWFFVLHACDAEQQLLLLLSSGP
jgi:quinol-cytochrome oxidoreductase complex cytochrome b subunit